MTAQTILPANSVVDTGYNVANSCRFDDGSSAYMHRTPSAGNRRTMTLSVWLKGSSLADGSNNVLGQYYSSNQNNAMLLVIEGSGKIMVWNYPTDNYNMDIRTNRRLRDNSAWYHIVVAVDTTQGTAANRVKIYVNGVQETSFSNETYPSQNLELFLNQNVAQNIGTQRYGSTVGSPWDGYMAEFCFIEGTQNAPTDFGEFDDSGIWKPIDVSDLTFGTNGYYLDFEDSSALGNDVSGNDNDFTTVNLAATDQTTDTCTNNFATMNILDNFYAAATLSEGNCKVTCNGSNTSFITSTFGLTKGKWYWEAKLTTVGGEESVGITDLVSTATDNYAGQTANSYSFKGNNGNIRNDDDNTSYGSAYGTSVIGVYMDLDNNKLYFAINGTIQASGTGFAITAAASTTNGFYFPMVGDVDSDSPVWEVNFGNPVSALSSAVSDANGFGAFEYSPSDGGSASFDSAAKSFLAICSKNLATDG